MSETGVGVPGAVGSKVTSCVVPSAPGPADEHSLTVGHAIRNPALTLTALGVPGAVGSNVNSRPSESTAVH